MYQFKLNDPHFLPHYGCDILLSVEKGKAIAVTGGNGIGKTSLARRFSEQSSTLISYIEQKELDHFYDRKLSQLKKIFLASRLDQIDSSLFHSLWEAFNLHAKEDRLLSDLSGGEGQALKLCLGLSSKKEVYLLDEPSQYLDSSSKKCLDRIIQDKLHSMKSVVLIEHDLSWVTFPLSKFALVVEEKSLKVDQ